MQRRVEGEGQDMEEEEEEDKEDADAMKEDEEEEEEEVVEEETTMNNHNSQQAVAIRGLRLCLLGGAAPANNATMDTGPERVSSRIDRHGSAKVDDMPNSVVSAYRVAA